ncbi:hypothetical protein [Chromohalobacter sp. HP20-39]|uniref:hypothetical protein n=1 Tax=Chromohalobacter sp. HP20-39 TaxID=3079306 RepID=UPI00294B7C16|nr:hypothetical protein [Chromohalobacter sp. HP20-39]MDV6318855.1 hypothetical protein [Chromohalobacter sp. HP20-39]
MLYSPHHRLHIFHRFSLLDLLLESVAFAGQLLRLHKGLDVLEHFAGQLTHRLGIAIGIAPSEDAVEYRRRRGLAVAASVDP